MKKELITTDKVILPNPAKGVHAVRAGQFVFVTGQVGRFYETGRLATSLEEQTRQTIANIKTILEAASTSLEHTVKRNVYIRDRHDMDRVRPIINELWPGKAAGTVVECGLLGPDPGGTEMLIEIDVIAVIPD